ncbi:MAG: hypothetical protein PHN79_05525, partial [Methanoregula sp.]|nr:hypothetical protein [Methanoregula sp.]
THTTTHFVTQLEVPEYLLIWYNYSAIHHRCNPFQHEFGTNTTGEIHMCGKTYLHVSGDDFLTEISFAMTANQVR